MQIYKSYAFDIQLNRLKYLVKIVFVWTIEISFQVFEILH